MRLYEFVATVPKFFKSGEGETYLVQSETDEKALDLLKAYLKSNTPKNTDQKKLLTLQMTSVPVTLTTNKVWHADGGLTAAFPKYLQTMKKFQIPLIKFVGTQHK